MLIVALDPPVNEDINLWIKYRYEILMDVVQGFKIGLPAIVKYGVDNIAYNFKGYDGLLIADLKLADIGDIMALVAKWLKVAGFNTIIAHSFVGYKQGLEVLARTCKEKGLNLVIVVSMSHDGSKEFIDKHIDEFVELAKNVETWGVVAPATRPEIIKYIRSKLGTNVKILSPGVGVQGALPGDAICAGADYEIVGRAITHAVNIREVALNIIKQQKRKVMECRG
ncbi:MAG: orotidine-5'-phosphate decarboxylase [Ignisphaera sp.]|uniref:Orotidine 5'-phosphate decarboxylase n=1 Tax=Ignisphaera aggregans TaxID=334771 RepID=A0A7C4NLH6_9CREN